LIAVHVIPYTQARYAVDFSQASVYLDSCFLLAYYDVENERGDKASRMIEWWEQAKIAKVGISNHTFTEVINNIFNARIVLAMAMQRKLNKNLPLAPGDDTSKIGDSRLMNRMIQLAGESRVDAYLAGEAVRFYVPGLIKQIKDERYYRTHLDFHYNVAVNEFRDLLNIFTLKNIPLQILDSGAIDQHLASSFMRTMRLDAPDAIQFAVATNSGYSHFITMDRDFANSLDSAPSLSNVTIIDLAA
jgi:predicted nucleic acid-binding protein